MAFIESPRLLDRVRFGYQSGPEFQTRIVLLDNGREQRNQNWVNPRRKFTVPFNDITPAQYATVLDAHYAARGAANGFRWKDWVDFTATLEPLGTTPSGSTPVQLVKTYATAANPYVRKIVKPVSCTMFQAGTPKAGTLDTTTGLFTPTTAWTAAQALTWSGEFDVPVRFVNDHLPATWDNYQLRTVDLELIEILL